MKMSGYSDVRLVLKSQELQTQRHGVRVNSGARPEGFTRWQWFWLCHRTRQQLNGLTAEQLHDIGLTAEQARAEALKAFWQR
jgi:uncharacterized protein YjiS (DUF1127 family)